MALEMVLQRADELDEIAAQAEKRAARRANAHPN